MQTIQLPLISTNKGDIVINNLAPFTIERVYTMYNVCGTTRGNHAYKTTDNFIIPISGSLVVKGTDVNGQFSYLANDKSIGILLPRLTWHELSEFSIDSVCLVLSSKSYDESDHINNYSDFLELIKDHK